MGLLKTLGKLALLLFIGALAVGAVTAMAKRRGGGPVSVDQWPTVAANPEA